MDRDDPMQAPLLGDEERRLHEQRPSDTAPHAQGGHQHVGWLSEQLHGSGGGGGGISGTLGESPGREMLAVAAGMLPAGYHPPKVSTRALVRHQSMPSTRAR